ncbi:MAG: Panacea domain-containing protein, partial [Nitrospirota bacterium]
MTTKRKFFRFDPDKAIQAILFVARSITGATFHQISKIIYFADKDHLQKYGRLICGDSYVAMKHGPVPSG